MSIMGFGIEELLLIALLQLTMFYVARRFFLFNRVVNVQEPPQKNNEGEILTLSIPFVVYEPLKEGTIYYTPTPDTKLGYTEHNWHADDENMMHLDRGLVHLSATNAKKHSEVLESISVKIAVAHIRNRIEEIKKSV